MNLKSILFLLFCLLLTGVAVAKDQTKVIAHRGYWKCEGSAQNSILSLERASEIGAYYDEFITTDLPEEAQKIVLLPAQ